GIRPLIVSIKTLGFPGRDFQTVRGLFPFRIWFHLRLIFHKISRLTQDAYDSFAGRRDRLERDSLGLAVLPLVGDDGIDRIAVFREPDAFFIGYNPRASVIDCFSVDEHPESDFAQTVFLFDRQFTVRLWPDVE